MQKFITGLLLGIIIGGGGLWFYQQRHTDEVRVKGKEAAKVAENIREILDAKLEVLGLQADRIRREMAEKGRIVRRKADELAEKASDATADFRITTVIKTKLAAAPELSALDISVSTTNGIVTLSGKVADPDLVGRAVLLALETENVREVISTLQIEKPGNSSERSGRKDGTVSPRVRKFAEGAERQSFVGPVLNL